MRGRLAPALCAFMIALLLPGPMADADAAPRKRKPAARPAPVSVPLPRPRPVSPAAAQQEPANKRGSKPDAPDAKPQEPSAAAESKPADAPAAPPQMSAEAAGCAARIGIDAAVVEPLLPFRGNGECGAENAVRLVAVRDRDGREIKLQPAATLQCPMAEALVRWLREDVAGALGAPLAWVSAAPSYECRGRNGAAGGKLSEHGRANALDIALFALADGRRVAPTDRALERALRESLKASACARFTTVLGPGSDGYHEDHVHVDLIQRRSGYRLCQWEMQDPVAPLPRARPAAQVTAPE